MILLYKPVGLTPAKAVEKYKLLFPQYTNIPLGVAGRLDPMAEGLLVLMVGDENKNQEYFMGLDKTYTVEMILGVSTDSYDLLGLPLLQTKTPIRLTNKEAQAVLDSFTGEQMQYYPPYSAVRVQGKPLHWWTRHGRLSEVEVPKALRNFYSITLDKNSSWTAQLLFDYARRIIPLVDGDFRQSESILSWQKALTNLPRDYTFRHVSFTAHCSSGSYIRTLVNDIGKALGCGATTVRIARTKVGDWDIKDAEILNV